jgi:hypothetical protein
MMTDEEHLERIKAALATARLCGVQWFGHVDDTEWLLAEVERLTAERDALAHNVRILRACCEVVASHLARGRTVGGIKPDLLELEEVLRAELRLTEATDGK